MEKNVLEKNAEDTQPTTFKKVDSQTQKIEMQKMHAKRKKTKIIVISSIIIITLIFLLGISTIFSLFTITNENILSCVSISGIEMSGLSKEEAKAKLDLLYNEKKAKDIDISYQEYETTLNPTAMEVNYDIDKAVNEAYLVGRKNNIFLSNYEVLFTLINKKNINVNMTLNEDATKQILDGLSISLPGVVLESSYSVDDDELIILKGKDGIVVDTEKLLSNVKDKLNDIHTTENYIEIPVLQKSPEPIDIDKIHAEICTEAKDAYYTKEPFVVYPEVEGVDFDLESAKALLAEEKDEYVIKLTITKPKITLSQIGDEAFPDRVGHFTTRYDVSAVDRSSNLALACQKINGKVLLPGETFSYNKALGERTVAAGYKYGKVYEAGQVVDGIGGGICQISSTLYNAVLDANLDIVERRNHQFVTSYVEAGRDATVVYGAIDFQFKNTRKYPIKIVASAKAGIATVSLYGIKEEKEYTVKITTKAIGSIPFSTKYIEDSTLAAGTETLKQNGANGLKTETYITKYLDGKAVSTTLLSRDTYDAMQKIIIKGTKGASNTTTTEPTSVAPSTTTPEVTHESTPSESSTTNNNTEPSSSTPSVETTPSENTDTTTPSTD